MDTISCYMFKDVSVCVGHTNNKCTECDYHDTLSFVHPMLLSEIPGHRELINSQESVYIQPKLKGWCGMANTRTRNIYTRNGREITTMPHINAALPTDGPEWLHGEYYAHGFTEDEIAAMIRRGDSGVKFHVFDCVSDDPFSARYIDISNVENEHIKLVHTGICGPAYVHHIYNAHLKAGYEGCVIRLNGYAYRHGRSMFIFKMKPGTEVL